MHAMYMQVRGQAINLPCSSSCPPARVSHVSHHSANTTWWQRCKRTGSAFGRHQDYPKVSSASDIAHFGAEKLPKSRPSDGVFNARRADSVHASRARESHHTRCVHNRRNHTARHAVVTVDIRDGGRRSI